MKRMLCMICVFLTLIAFLSFSALADNEKKSGLFTYEIKGNGTAIITGFDWSSNNGQDIYVPNMLDGYTVTEIGPSAFNLEYTVPTQLYYYSMNAMSDNNAGKPAAMIYDFFEGYADDDECLTPLGVVGEEVVVVLPNTITVIGERAFIATRITAINIPSSVQLIGAGAFACCPYLKAFSVDSNNEVYATIDDVLYQKVQKELVCYPLGKVTPKQTIKVPNGISSIGDFAFFGIYLQKYTGHGTEIILPSSLTKIGNYAFYGCVLGENGIDFSSVDTQFKLPNSVETIGEYAFAYAEINEVNWPTSLHTIKTGAFSHAMLYQKQGYGTLMIQLPESVTTIEEYAFDNSQSNYNGRSADILDLSLTQITSVSANAFSGTRFSKIQLPGTIKQICEGAFSEATGVVTIPASVEQIDDSAFAYGGGNVFFSENASLAKIGDSVFRKYHFNGQGTVKLPDGLIEIGAHAFDETTDLTTLVIPDSVSKIGDGICNRADVKLEVSSGSYGAIWASENGYSIKSTGGDDTSWLND